MSEEKCVFCSGNGWTDEIIDHDANYNSVWQRRDCDSCGGTGTKKPKPVNYEQMWRDEVAKNKQLTHEMARYINTLIDIKRYGDEFGYMADEILDEFSSYRRRKK